MSKKKLTPFIFKLASNVLLEFDNFHVFSQQDVGNECKLVLRMHFLKGKCVLVSSGNIIHMSNF